MTKRFDTVAAVDRLTLRVPRGSIYGFLGPNGAGKTTTMRMLAGLARPDAGRIIIDGLEAGFGRLTALNFIGYLPDEPVFYDWMTAGEYLQFVGRIFRLTIARIQERVAALLDQVGLADESKRIGAFSRGMKKRLGIAGALINQPKLLVCDEPTAALDPLGREAMFAVLGALQPATTVILSTHILDDVERVCDYVGIINHGKLITELPLAELKQKWQSQIIRLAIAGPPGVLEAAVRREPWISRLTAKDSYFELEAADLSRAERELPGLIYEAGLSLLHFEIVTPPLEEIFTRLVSGESHA